MTGAASNSSSASGASGEKAKAASAPPLATAMGSSNPWAQAAAKSSQRSGDATSVHGAGGKTPASPAPVSAAAAVQSGAEVNKQITGGADAPGRGASRAMPSSAAQEATATAGALARASEGSAASLPAQTTGVAYVGPTTRESLIPVSAAIGSAASLSNETTATASAAPASVGTSSQNAPASKAENSAARAIAPASSGSSSGEKSGMALASLGATFLASTKARFSNNDGPVLPVLGPQGRVTHTSSSQIPKHVNEGRKSTELINPNTLENTISRGRPETHDPLDEAAEIADFVNRKS